MRFRSRIITRALVLLLLGAIVNVAGALGIWILPVSLKSAPMVQPSASDVRWWKENVPAGFAERPNLQGNLPSFGRWVSASYFDQLPDGHNPRIHQGIQRLRAGWPLLVLDGAMWFDPIDGGVCHKGLFYPPAGWPRSASGVPVRPIWPAFAINTLFYAIVLWLPFGASALRRRRRITRGLCPACAYPVGDSPVCTECGKQLPSPSR